MSYRDDLDAAVARAHAAERELEGTRAELEAALRGTVPPERFVRLERELADARGRLALLPAAVWTTALLGLASLVLLAALLTTSAQATDARRDTERVRERCMHVIRLPAIESGR
jgi:hypothetical protein